MPESTFVLTLSSKGRNRSVGWCKHALISLMILATPAGADDFEKAMSDAAAGNYGEAAAGFHKLALTGDPEAAHNLAILFASGRGLPQNSVEAAFWAWRARLAGLRQAAPLVIQLMQDLTAERQATVATRLPEPDFASAHAWQSIAAAVDVPGAIAARNATLESTAPEHRQKVQDQAMTAFKDWCGRQAQNAPAACVPVTK